MSHEFHLHWGLHALLKLLRDYSFETVLDIGSGLGEHTRFFRLFNKQVTTCNLLPPADWVGDFLEAPISGSFDVIWCCHMLEHQRNPGLVLDKIYRLLRPEGILVLCLPHHPPSRLVPGHLSTWSLALASLHLVYAGFDCKHLSAYTSYELSLIVQKPKEQIPIHRVQPSWQEITPYFPNSLKIGAEQDQVLLNWENELYYPLVHSSAQDPILIHSKNLNAYPCFRPSVVLFKS